MLSEVLQGNFMWLIGLVIAITIHEFSHALAADKLGDPTPRLMGRLTLNPLAHLDPLGTLFMLITRFGWGKPVPFDPFNLREPRKDAALISLAGPASNLILAVFLSAIVRLLFLLQTEALGITIAGLLLPIIIINISLAVFNLLPISPLDGFKVVGGILPEDLSRSWYQLEKLGYLILLFFVFMTPEFLSMTVVPVMNFFLKLFLGNSLF